MAESTESYKRVVIEGQWDGNVIPGKIEELKREVFVRSGSLVHGGIFGHRIHLDGPCDVSKAIYATDGVEVQAGGRVHLRSSVGAKNAVKIAGGTDWAFIQGDVIAEKVALEKCVVTGSISGDVVALRSVICLGLVEGTQLASLDHCTVLSASGGRLVFGEGCGVILPFARALQSLEIRAPISYVGIDADESALTQLDVVRHEDGHQYLTAGRRLIDFRRIRHQVENIGNFMLHSTVTSGSAEVSERFPFNVEELPRDLLLVRSMLAESSAGT